jgi:hypothetical protein
MRKDFQHEERGEDCGSVRGAEGNGRGALTNISDEEHPSVFRKTQVSKRSSTMKKYKKKVYRNRCFR